MPTLPKINRNKLFQVITESTDLTEETRAWVETLIIEILAEDETLLLQLRDGEDFQKQVKAEVLANLLKRTME